MKPPRPNILFIFTDQLRADALAFAGHPFVRTPNLDRLAARSTAFNSAYTPSPVCVPARCSLLYGQYPFTTGCNDNNTPFPSDGRATYPGALASMGYRTHAIGKCHFVPDRHALNGFQSRQSQEEILASVDEDDYLRFLRDEGFGHITDPNGVRGEMYYIPQVAQMPARLHPTQWVGDQAVKFIGAQSADRPWLLYAGIIHPHPPFAPPTPWHKLYRTKDMPAPHMPDAGDELKIFINRAQNRYKYRGNGYDLNLARTIIAYYHACVSFIDFQVGRMMDELERTGQLDNTMIVFSSDHGELLGDYGCYGKRSMHDAAMRVPLLVHLPGRFEAGANIDAPVSLVDLMPTFLAAAGADAMPAGLDGVDLADAGALAKRDAVFVQFSQSGTGVYSTVTRDWKYTYSAPDNRELLFDRRTPRPDDVELSATARPATTLLRQKLIARLKESHCDHAIDGDAWRVYPKLSVPDDPNARLLIQDHPWADQRVPGYS
jgi:arylsulfatase A-like enzyme